ncbi:MAG: Gfo/Idh/MocA family oxidoreductase [Clostridia bacterium]|nr:Gfo/Idh/MocA family oxidoreductase [Clostridia bacterium]
MNDLITIAVIGCGRIANGAHLPVLASLENVRIKYACDLIREKAEKAKADYPKIEQVITDYRIALGDPEVEAVFVLTPNYSHYEVTMDALRAGKHVMCEKPVTVNYALSAEMAAAADKYGRILNIGVCNRYHRSVEMLRELNEQGRFGNIYHVYCSFRAFRSIPGLGGAFTTKAQSGGGVLIDWGIHFFDLILYILGGPALRSATCDAYSEMAKDMKAYKYHGMWAEDTADFEHGTNDVDDFITGYIRTDGAGISFNGAWAQNIDKSEMFIDFLGDKAGARLSYGGKFEIYDGNTLETIRPEYDIPDMYRLEDMAFFDSVRTGIKNRSNVDNVLNSMLLLDTLYRSADLKREITPDVDQMAQCGPKAADYNGKYFSVVGDSISTLLGTIPDGYALYYDEHFKKQAGIEEEKDTWWGQIIDRLGGKRLKNNSWSGSTVSYHAEFTPGSFAHLDSRMSLLGDGSIAPDVIMIYMGVNDWASGTPIEAYGGMMENQSFAGAYRIMLDLIKKHYPNAEVWCISPAVSTLRGDPAYEFPYRLGGIHLREYADAIGKVAAEKGCVFVDANKNTRLVDAMDGIHPDKNGMMTLADEILKARGICC